MESKDKWGIKFKFPERTCEECRKYPCFDGQADHCRCDFAKYGCIDYAENNNSG